MNKGNSETGKRRQSEARKVAREAYPYRACAVCGLSLPTAIDLAHLDQDASNNAPDNLAWLCKTHHWMYDAGLYPAAALEALRDHWQRTKGKPDHSARMKDAGPKAARTRKRRAAAKKAVATRRARSSSPQSR